MKNQRLYRIILPVNDIKKAKNYYRMLFDQEGTSVSPGRHYFDLGGTILACYDPKADGDDLGDGWKFHENQFIYIAVEDLDYVFKKMNSSDSKYVSKIEQMPWGEVLFYARDPFDNPICFVDEKTIFTG